MDKTGQPIWATVKSSALARIELPHALTRHKKQFADGLIGHMNTEWELEGLQSWVIYWERDGAVGYLVPLLSEVLPDSLPITDDDLRGWD